MKNVILDSIEMVEDYIMDKSLLKMKNKTLLQLFISSNKKILLVNEPFLSYVCFDYIDNVKDKNYVELELSDLKIYSKYQLILLYQGWHIQDGLTTAILINPKEVGFCYKGGKAVMRSLPRFSLPYRNIPVNEFTSFCEESQKRWKEIVNNKTM